jgi:hypothetical protein
MINFSPKYVSNNNNIFSGTLNNVGGSGSSPGLDGDHGVSQSQPPCDAGYGGAFCLPCGPGTSKPSEGDNAYCRPCDPGFYSNASVNQACMPCDEYSVAPTPGLSRCVRCGIGFMPDVNRTKCSTCAPGYSGAMCTPCPSGFAKPLPGMGVCTPCPAGTASASTGILCEGCPPNTYSTISSSRCVFCNVGTFTLGNASICTACPARPQHSQWDGWMPPSVSGYSSETAKAEIAHKPSSAIPAATVSPTVTPAGPLPAMCQFKCNDGYLAYPKCITVLEVAWGGMGGITTVSIFIALAIIVFLPTCAKPKSLRRTSAWIPDAEVGGGVAAADDKDAQADLMDDPAFYWGAVTFEELELKNMPRSLCSWLCDTMRAFCSCGSSQDQSSGRGSSAAVLLPNTPTARRRQTGSINSGSRLLGGVESSALRRGIRMGGDTSDAAGSGSNRGLESIGTPPRSPAASPSASAIAALSAFQLQSHPQETHRRMLQAAAAIRSPVSKPEPSVGLGTALLSQRLELCDLPRHLHRVYFIGHNSPAHPLLLHPRVPPELAAVVSEAEYAAHAQACNALSQWRAWETRVANFLRLVWLPGALLFEASRRAAHIFALLRLHSEYNHSFLRNTRSRALGNCVQFGCSRDNHLAYIDILVFDSTEDAGGAPIGQPRER